MTRGQAATVSAAAPIALALLLLASPPLSPSLLVDASPNADTASASSPQQNQQVCRPHGCYLLPRDVAFDEDARGALKAIRDGPSSSATSNASGEEDDSAVEDGPEEEEGGAGDEMRNSFGDALRHLRHAGSESAATLTLIGYKGGRLEDQINQDRAFVLSPFRISYGENPQEGGDENGDRGVGERAGGEDAGDVNDAVLLGVFDGHGTLGEVVSEYATDRVPAVLSRKLREIRSLSSRENGGADAGAGEEEKDFWNRPETVDAVRTALTESFVEVDEVGREELELPSGGCTATVILKLGRKIYAANAGDSRSFVAAHIRGARGSGGGDSGKNGGGGKGRVMLLLATREDKPHLPDERARVESAGGRVWLPNAEELSQGDSSRVMYIDPETGQAGGGLAMSRSIGDWDLGEVGVVPDPLVDVLDLGEVKRQAAKWEKDGGDGGECTEEEREAGSCVQREEKKKTADAEAMQSSDDVSVFAVSATDGILDYVSPQDVVEAAAEALYGFIPTNAAKTTPPSGTESQEPIHLFTACEDLIINAAHGWHADAGGSYRDDMAVAVSVIV